jgi:hypothetical protein
VLAGRTKLESTLDAAASHTGRSAFGATLSAVVARLSQLEQWLVRMFKGTQAYTPKWFPAWSQPSVPGRPRKIDVLGMTKMPAGF